MGFYQDLSKIDYSNDCYISGMLALNIADYENNTGDWHRTVFWNDNSKLSASHIMGKKSPISNIDTNAIFGDSGIYKANEVLKKMGVPNFSDNVLAANHARSIADLVVYLAYQEKNPCSVIDFYSFDDFMELDSDKEKVFNLLEVSLKSIKEKRSREIVNNWLEAARSFSYE